VGGDKVLLPKSPLLQPRGHVNTKFVRLDSDGLRYGQEHSHEADANRLSRPQKVRFIVPKHSRAFNVKRSDSRLSFSKHFREFRPIRPAIVIVSCPDHSPIPDCPASTGRPPAELLEQPTSRSPYRKAHHFPAAAITGYPNIMPIHARHLL